MIFYAVAIALPFIGALQYFAVAYGYKGHSRAHAVAEARLVFGVLALIGAGLAASHAWW